MLYYHKTPQYYHFWVTAMNNYVTYLDVNKYHDLYTRTSGRFITFSLPCIGYLLSGNAEFLYDGKTISANEGDLIYIAPETRYYSLWTGRPDIELYSFNFNLKNMSDFLNYRFQVIKSFPKQLLDNVYNSNGGNFFELMSHFNMLLAEIYKRAEKKSYHSKYERLKPAIDFIEENFDKPFSIEQLAKLCNYSEPRFFSLFKETTGVTPIVYKHNTAIQHALKYLSETSLSIEQISNKLGFSSSNYFRTVFFKYTGKTPKEIRKSAFLLSDR